MRQLTRGMFLSTRRRRTTVTPLEQGEQRLIVLTDEEEEKEEGSGGVRGLFSRAEAETCSERGKVTSHENNVVRFARS